MPRRVDTTDPAAMTALVDHVRTHLGLRTSAALPSIDTSMVTLAMAHGCAAILERTMTTSGISADVGTMLQVARRDRMLRSISARSITSTAIGELRQEGVEALVVKGIALAALTGRAAAERPGNDIDLLVRADDLLAAHRTLTGAGWHSEPEFPPPAHDTRTRYVTWNYHEAAYRRDGAEIDLHWRLSPVRFRGLHTEALFERSVEATIDGTTVPTMSPDDALAHITASAGKDRWRSLAAVVDLHLLLEHGASFDRIERHFPATGVVSAARSAVEFLRSGEPEPVTRRQRQWWKRVTSVYDDRQHMTSTESITFRARWFALAPTPGNAAISMCNLVLPPAALTWSRLPARWWPLALPERAWRAVRRRGTSTTPTATPVVRPTDGRSRA